MFCLSFSHLLPLKYNSNNNKGINVPSHTQKLNLPLILKDLLVPGSVVRVDLPNLAVTGLSKDSKTIQKNNLFVAIKGQKHDGHDHISAAIQAGANLCIAERVPNNTDPHKVLLVKNSRKAWGILNHAYFGFPSSKLKCFGVTGTNGKTSSAYIIEFLLNHLGVETAVLGTVDHHFKNKIWPTQLTTPDSAELYQRLAEMSALGAQSVAMEISSHSIDQGRCAALELDCAVFTNLTRDHLDYHLTIEDYFQAKLKLFTEILQISTKPNRAAAINVDDDFGKRIKSATLPAIKIVGFGKSPSAEFKFQLTESNLSGQRFTINYKNKQYLAFVPLVGEHNVYNVVGCLAALAAQGYDLEKMIQIVSKFPGVPGRLQPVHANHSKGPFVFVDYAHSPDALEKVLKALKQIQGLRKLKVLFGCGGDRDKGKRPMMAQISESLADEIVVTSDNPRTEDPEKIIDDIMKGFKNPQLIHRQSDRRKALQHIVQNAGQADAVLIAGKGHEDYQIIGDKKYPFSDVEECRNFLNSKGV